MTRRISLIVGIGVTAMALATPALAMYPDGETLLSVQPSNQYLDAHQRAVVSGGNTPTAALYSDAFERAMVAGQRGGASVVGDSHERVGRADTPVSGTTVSSGREIEWPQVGIGLGVGIVLALGLLLTIRFARVRPIAH
jgi:hypothetical protein